MLLSNAWNPQNSILQIDSQSWNNVRNGCRVCHERVGRHASTLILLVVTSVTMTSSKSSERRYNDDGEFVEMVRLIRVGETASHLFRTRPHLSSLTLQPPHTLLTPLRSHSLVSINSTTRSQNHNLYTRPGDLPGYPTRVVGATTFIRLAMMMLCCQPSGKSDKLMFDYFDSRSGQRTN